MIRNLVFVVALTLTVTLINHLPMKVYSKSFLQEKENLLADGDFESGNTCNWDGLTNENLVTAPSFSGNYAVRITEGEASQDNIPVVPGKYYLFTAWFRWEVFEGQDWGYDRIRISNTDWSEIASLSKMHRTREPGIWHKIAIVFKTEAPTIRITFGLFGPQDQVELYFDDIQLIEKGENIPPTVSITANGSYGAAPYTVSFTANSQDEDGAVMSYYWDFGDGSLSTRENPDHTYMSPGTYSVRLAVRDNEGAQAISSHTIIVTNTNAPEIEVRSQRIYAINHEKRAIALSGVARSINGSYIVSMVWDHVSTGDSGILEVTPADVMQWTFPEIPLKPGRNEILLTAADDHSNVAIEKIILFIPLIGPSITNIEKSAALVGQFEKFEISFQLDTVADNYLFRYDPEPPMGIQPGIGVSVTGIFTTPSGKTLEQPGFFYQEAVAFSCGISSCYMQTEKNHWTIRFSPQETGKYQVAIRAEDSSGITTLPVGDFIAVSSDNKGYIRVSTVDPRYFEHTTGELFWPIGPAHGNFYSSYKETGQNFERPWMAGIGAYSTNFARWVSSAYEMRNEGFDSNLTFTERYPGHELSQVLTYPDANRIWIGWSGESFRPLLQPEIEYQILLRLKTVNLSGPTDSNFPHGLMIKTHGWPSENFELDMREHPSLIPPVAYNADWHTVINRYTAVDRDVNRGESRVYISLYLDNIVSGEVYIDYFSIRQVLPGDHLGPELMVNPSADLHTYIEPGPAAFIDWQVKQGEQNGVYFKYVVHDKRDWIQNHLNQYGQFVEYGDGYYQERNTKARWLLEQWWRYLIARWGYTSAIHSWEMNNEGPPHDHAHYQMAQEFAQFMHENDAHPHLATTSFWADWSHELWTNRTKYPDIDYANIHEYIKDRQTGYDVSGWMLDRNSRIYESQAPIPVMYGETGIAGPGNEVFAYLSEQNPGIWYHNSIWVQLSPEPVYNPNYWWAQHLHQFRRREISRSFRAFVNTLDLNQGGYTDGDAYSDNAMLRAVGQKNLSKDQAHLWIQNSRHTWRNVMGVDDPVPIVPQSGSLVIKMNPAVRYTIQWWDTYAGVVTKTETVSSDANGYLKLIITNLDSDLAIRLFPEERPLND
jgi:PKD repeat protein